MKKLLVVVALVTVGIKADFWSDLGKGDLSGAFNDVAQSPEVQSVVSEAQKLVPPQVQTQVQEIVVKYGPTVAQEAQKAAVQGQQLLSQVIPTEQQKELLAKGTEIIAKAAEVAKAQVQNNPALLKQAQQMLASNQNQLNLMKKHALEIVNKNPNAKAIVNQYVNDIQARTEMIKKAEQVRNDIMNRTKNLFPRR